jgi:CheY-like chemotaxis protein
MPLSGPIVIIEDDLDDQEIITDVINDIGVQNKIMFFDNCSDAFTFLKSTLKQPFLILCDINLPAMNGFEFKSEIDNDIKLMEKSIPFIFFSTAATKPIVTEAYTKMTVQGFFQKNENVEELKYSLKTIIEYWKLCKHPNASFD